MASPQLHHREAFRTTAAWALASPLYSFEALLYSSRNDLAL